jgi:MFS family permease
LNESCSTKAVRVKLDKCIIEFLDRPRAENILKDKLSEYRSDGSETGKPDWGGSGLSTFFKRTFISFSNPAYRFYYVAMAGHWSSMSMQMVVRSLLIYRITGSEAILGLNSLANAIPMLLVSLPGGVIADRVQKKTVVQLSQVAAGSITLWVTIMLLTGYLSPEHPNSWWVVVASAALQGLNMGIQMPSRQAIISELVSEEHLMNAISLNNLGMNVFRLLSPALAGFLIDAFGFYIVYAVMTGMYAIALICMAFVPATTGPKRTHQSSSVGEIVDTWRYIRREKPIFLVMIFSVLATVLGMPYTQLLPVFTESILKVSATNLGILISVSGAGAIVGSLIIANLTNKKRGTYLLLAGLMMSAALLGFAFSRWWYLSLFLIMFVGAGNTGQMALGNSLIQYYSDASYRGRVLSFFYLCFGFGSLGAFFAGLLAESIGAPLAVGGMTAILLVITLIMLGTAPKLRNLD